MTDIRHWLEQHGLGKYAELFAENEVELANSETRNPGTALELDWVEEARVNRSAVERRTATLLTRRTVKKAWQAAYSVQLSLTPNSNRCELNLSKRTAMTPSSFKSWFMFSSPIREQVPVTSLWSRSAPHGSRKFGKINEPASVDLSTFPGAWLNVYSRRFAVSRAKDSLEGPADALEEASRPSAFARACIVGGFFQRSATILLPPSRASRPAAR